MSGRTRPSQGQATRHGRRAPRSAVSGPGLPDPNSRIRVFERTARATVGYLQNQLEGRLDGVRIEFTTVPTTAEDSAEPAYYRVDRPSRSIMLYRFPIQRARGLHVDDESHRRMFIEHCVFLAVAEYLGEDPWDLLPGQFEHF
ncbi:hypothetical protein [Leucobacter sp. M11]|uniref:hypothetical protein n=1 Tax=Leucobacter sp. M11 TaxID=2993565 RepID=UPI002D80F099|nr:hypothetical protein [Leucobacter sp. M11]MEB4615447.1 hypothetical protein [Leucobacter sp. M11]